MCIPFNHKWEIIGKDLIGNSGWLFTLQCKKCGDIKKKQIIATIWE